MPIDVTDWPIGKAVALPADRNSVDGQKPVMATQTFTLQGIRNHRRVDGKETYILEWSAECCLCGHRYEFTSTRFRMTPTRTCEVHRGKLKMGRKRVRKQK